MQRGDYPHAEAVLEDVRQAAPNLATVHAQIGVLRALKRDRSAASRLRARWSWTRCNSRP